LRTEIALILKELAYQKRYDNTSGKVSCVWLNYKEKDRDFFAGEDVRPYKAKEFFEINELYQNTDIHILQITGNEGT
jgi:hypothetical protein